jgi:type II secretory pathway pseudopilin PulG
MLKSQRGFGLVEVMVSVGLLGAIAFGVMQFTKSSSESQRKMAFNNSLNAFTNSIQTELAKKENCSASLQGLPIGGTVLQIREGMVDPLNPAVIIPTGKILMRVRNPLDKGHGLYIESMRLTTNDAGKEVLRTVFRAGYVNPNGTIKNVKMLGSSQIRKDFIINAIKNPVTGVITSCYSDFTNLMNTMDTKLCKVEKKIVEAVGGTTENCQPNITVNRLHMFIHKDTECTALGGSVQTVEGTVKLCRFNAAACPAGWTQFKNWTTTSKRICNASLQRGNGVNGNAWNACSNNNNIMSRCGWGKVNESGEHAWSDNGTIEEKSYETVLRVCYGGNCGDSVCYDNTVGNTYIDCGYSGGGSTRQICRAIRTQVGCY